jgi:hypothetical protein
MSVYVDDMRAPFGRMIMCHLWADSTEELLNFVDRIGVDRKWIQGHPILSLPRARNASWVHFDIALGKRKIAVELGAIETDRYGPLEFLSLAALRSENTSEEVKQRAREKLDQIASNRAARARARQDLT